MCAWHWCQSLLNIQIIILITVRLLLLPCENPLYLGNVYSTCTITTSLDDHTLWTKSYWNCTVSLPPVFPLQGSVVCPPTLNYNQLTIAVDLKFMELESCLCTGKSKLPSRIHFMTDVLWKKSVTKPLQMFCFHWSFTMRLDFVCYNGLYKMIGVQK